MPRYQTQMIMDFTRRADGIWHGGRGANGTGGYISANWADWSVLPAINVVNDVLYSGDLSQGE